MAIDADSGKTLWQHESPVAPLTLAADEDRIYFFDGKKVLAADRATGKVRWASHPLPVAKTIRSWFAPTLVVSDVQGKRVTQWKALPKIWSLFKKKDAFVEYVQDEVTGYLEDEE